MAIDPRGRHGSGRCCSLTSDLSAKPLLLPSRLRALRYTTAVRGPLVCFCCPDGCYPSNTAPRPSHEAWGSGSTPMSFARQGLLMSIRLEGASVFVVDATPRPPLPPSRRAAAGPGPPVPALASRLLIRLWPPSFPFGRMAQKFGGGPPARRQMSLASSCAAAGAPWTGTPSYCEELGAPGGPEPRMPCVCRPSDE